MRPIARKIVRALILIPALGFAYLAYVYLTLPDVRPLEKTNPKTTAFMELRKEEARDRGRNYCPDDCSADAWKNVRLPDRANDLASSRTILAKCANNHRYRLQFSSD